MQRRSLEEHVAELGDSPTPAPGAPRDHINIRIPKTMVSGIILVLGLGTRMSDPYVYVVFWGSNQCPEGPSRSLWSQKP